MRKKRQYKKGAPNSEYDFHGTKEQIKRRVARNKARRAAIKSGRVKKGDGKEVHHTKAKRKGPLTGPTRVVSKKKNRSIQPKRKKR